MESAMVALAYRPKKKAVHMETVAAVRASDQCHESNGNDQNQNPDNKGDDDSLT